MKRIVQFNAISYLCKTASKGIHQGTAIQAIPRIALSSLTLTELAYATQCAYANPISNHALAWHKVKALSK